MHTHPLARWLPAALPLLLAANAPADNLAVATSGAGSGLWSDPNAWTPKIVPNNSSSTTYDVTLVVDPFTIDIDPTINYFRVALDEDSRLNDFYLAGNPDRVLTITTGFDFGSNGYYGNFYPLVHVVTASTATTTFNGNLSTTDGFFTNNGTLYFVGGSLGGAYGGSHFLNNGSIIFNGPTYGSDLSEINVVNHGLIEAKANHLIIEGAAGSTGIYQVDPDATIIFAQPDYPDTGSHPVYDFSSPSGPSLTGSGSIVVAEDSTLILPIDSAFTGTIEIDGTLVLAPPLNPLNADITPAFTVLSAPEPASLALVACAALPLLTRRRRRF